MVMARGIDIGGSGDTSKEQAGHKCLREKQDKDERDRDLNHAHVVAPVTDGAHARCGEFLDEANNRRLLRWGAPTANDGWRLADNLLVGMSREKQTHNA